MEFVENTEANRRQLGESKAVITNGDDILSVAFYNHRKKRWEENNFDEYISNEAITHFMVLKLPDAEPRASQDGKIY